MKAAVAAADADPAGGSVDLGAGCVYTLTAPEPGGNGRDGLPVIQHDVVINGHGATIARSTAEGIPDFRIFDVEVPAGHLTLDAVTLRGGHLGGSFDGGAVLVAAGSLSLTASTVTASSAGGSGGGIAVRDGGKATFTNAVLDTDTAGHNGGAIALSRRTTATLIATHLRGNTAQGEGGAVFNAGTADLHSTVVSGSTSRSATAGGGLASHGALTRRDRHRRPRTAG